MSVAAAAFAIGLAAPAHGHAFAIGSTLLKSLLVTSASAIGCSPDGRRCPGSVGVTFADRPGLVYPAKVMRVLREDAEGTVVELRVDRGEIPAFLLATNAAAGDAVTIPAWCGSSSPTYISSVGQSGSHVRIGLAATADQAGCPVVDAAGRAVAVVRGPGDALRQQPGFQTLAAVLQNAANLFPNFYDPAWQDASRDEALARAREVSARDPDFPNGGGGANDIVHEQAMPWWCRAAEQGDAIAMAVCANALAHDQGVLNDLARALLLARRSRDAGIAGAAVIAAEIEQRYGASLALLPDLLARAQSGDTNAAFTLAGRYRNGYIGPADRTQADVWYARCAAANPDCAERLGVDLLHGWGVLADVPRAAALLEAAGKAGNGGAYYDLGDYYTDTFWPDRYDPVKARRYLELAAASPPATYAQLARAALAKLPKEESRAVAGAAEQPIEVRIAAANVVAETQNYAAAPLFKALGDTGDARALLAAAEFYRRSAALGWGRSSDDETALAYFKRASAAGSYRATYQVATFAKTLDEMKALWKLSMAQARKAAGDGDTAAFVYVGTGYAAGYDGTSDCKQGAVWLQRGAAANAAGAEYELGMLYTRDARLSEAPEGYPCLDVREGERWLRLGVEHKDRQAAYRLGFLLESGRLGRADIAQAKRIYAIGAALGDVLSAVRLRALTP